MRFKDFTDIDSLRHKQIEEKPVKNYTGDFKELSIAKPSSNTSKKTKSVECKRRKKTSTY